MQLLGAVALAGVLATGAAYVGGNWIGYDKGFAAAEAKAKDLQDETQRKAWKLATDVMRLAEELEDTKRQREGLINDLEQAARDDPDAVNRVPSADSLRRLQQRWD